MGRVVNPRSSIDVNKNFSVIATVVAEVGVTELDLVCRLTTLSLLIFRPMD